MRGSSINAAETAPLRPWCSASVDPGNGLDADHKEIYRYSDVIGILSSDRAKSMLELARRDAETWKEAWRKCPEAVWPVHSIEADQRAPEAVVVTVPRRGLTLRTMLRHRRTLSEREICDIAVAIVEALDTIQKCTGSLPELPALESIVFTPHGTSELREFGSVRIADIRQRAVTDEQLKEWLIRVLFALASQSSDRPTVPQEFKKEDLPCVATHWKRWKSLLTRLRTNLISLEALADELRQCRPLLIESRSLWYTLGATAALIVLSYGVFAWLDRGQTPLQRLEALRPLVRPVPWMDAGSAPPLMLLVGDATIDGQPAASYVEERLREAERNQLDETAARDTVERVEQLVKPRVEELKSLIVRWGARPERARTPADELAGSWVGGSRIDRVAFSRGIQALIGMAVLADQLDRIDQQELGIDSTAGAILAPLSTERGGRTAIELWRMKMDEHSRLLVPVDGAGEVSLGEYALDCRRAVFSDEWERRLRKKVESAEGVQADDFAECRQRVIEIREALGPLSDLVEWSPSPELVRSHAGSLLAPVTDEGRFNEGVMTRLREWSSRAGSFALSEEALRSSNELSARHSAASAAREWLTRALPRYVDSAAALSDGLSSAAELIAEIDPSRTSPEVRLVYEMKREEWTAVADRARDRIESGISAVRPALALLPDSASSIAFDMIRRDGNISGAIGTLLVAGAVLRDTPTPFGPADPEAVRAVESLASDLASVFDSVGAAGPTEELPLVNRGSPGALRSLSELAAETRLWKDRVSRGIDDPAKQELEGVSKDLRVRWSAPEAAAGEFLAMRELEGLVRAEQESPTDHAVRLLELGLRALESGVPPVVAAARRIAYAKYLSGELAQDDPRVCSSAESEIALHAQIIALEPSPAFLESITALSEVARRRALGCLEAMPVAAEADDPTIAVERAAGHVARFLALVPAARDDPEFAPARWTADALEAFKSAGADGEPASRFLGRLASLRSAAPRSADAGAGRLVNFAARVCDRLDHPDFQAPTRDEVIGVLRTIGPASVKSSKGIPLWELDETTLGHEPEGQDCRYIEYKPVDRPDEPSLGFVLVDPSEASSDCEQDAPGCAVYILATEISVAHLGGLLAADWRREGGEYRIEDLRGECGKPEGDEGDLVWPVRGYEIELFHDSEPQFNTLVRATPSWVALAEDEDRTIERAGVPSQMSRVYAGLTDLWGEPRWSEGVWPSGPTGPSLRHPATYLTFRAALELAAVAGCRLPSVDEWRRAVLAGGSPEAASALRLLGENSIEGVAPNLADESWRRHAVARAPLQQRRDITGPTYPGTDHGAHIRLSQTIWDGAAFETSVPVWVSHDDKHVWLRVAPPQEVPRSSLRAFDLIGNAAEWVTSDVIPASGQSASREDLGKARIAGLSAMTPLPLNQNRTPRTVEEFVRAVVVDPSEEELPDWPLSRQDALPATRITEFEISDRYSDVGFRLVFPAGRAHQPPVKRLYREAIVSALMKLPGR